MQGVAVYWAITLCATVVAKRVPRHASLCDIPRVVEMAWVLVGRLVRLQLKRMEDPGLRR
jgi:hypothetical protein